MILNKRQIEKLHKKALTETDVVVPHATAPVTVALIERLWVFERALEMTAQSELEARLALFNAERQLLSESKVQRRGSLAAHRPQMQQPQDYDSM